jgi:hypothetical protein
MKAQIHLWGSIGTPHSGTVTTVDLPPRTRLEKNRTRGYCLCVMECIFGYSSEKLAESLPSTVLFQPVLPVRNHRGAHPAFCPTHAQLVFRQYFSLKSIRANTVAVTVVRYHSGGSKKLNACILLLAHMVYLSPKHNSFISHIHTIA